MAWTAAQKIDAMMTEIGKLGIDAVGESVRILTHDPVAKLADQLTVIAQAKRADVTGVSLGLRQGGWIVMVSYAPAGGKPGSTRFNVRLLSDARPRVEGWLLRVAQAGRSS